MKILALDGGGVFGRIQARILSDSGCSGKFDAYIGTSIGSVIATALALGKGDRVSPEFFDNWMPKVFKTSLFQKYNIMSPEYPDDGLNLALKDVFGSSLFGEATKPVFVTAADIGQKTLKVFSSASFEDQTKPAWEVCRCATAAETFFKPWKGMADGGIYANNPSMVGLAAAVRVMGAKIEDIEILSIGTGSEAGMAENDPITRPAWAIWVLRAMLSGSADKMHDYFVRSLPIKRYQRVQFIREVGWEMDNPKSMYYAERKWSSEIKNAVQIVKNF